MWLVVSQLVSQETVLSSFLFTCTPQTFITAPVISRTFSYDSFAVVVCVSGGQGMVAQLLALPPHSKKVMGLIPTWGAVGSGGQVLPRVHSAQVGYLPVLSVWSLHVLPVFTRGFLQ